MASNREPAPFSMRMARADDDEFIIGLATRFTEFDLPAWRKRSDVIAWLREDLSRITSTLPPGSHLFIAEDDDGERVGFLHLQTVKDAFSEASNCHVSDLACAPGHDGKGVGAFLLDYAEDWAKRHRCRHLSLAVFAGNQRAIALYERRGFGVEIHRMIKKLD